MPHRTPAKSVKAERQDNERPGPADEDPAAKRTRLFRSQMQGPQPPTAPRLIRNADDLDDLELMEIYKIADTAVAAQDSSCQATPAVVEEFLGRVFKEWTSEQSMLDTASESSLVELRVAVVSVNPVGELVAASGQVPKLVPVHYHLKILRDRLSDARSGNYAEAGLQLSPTIDLSANSRSMLSTSTRKIRWKTWNECDAEYQHTRAALLEKLSKLYATHNATRAVTYARLMLHRRSCGASISAARGVYDFDRMENDMCLVPGLAAGHGTPPRVFGSAEAVRRA